MKRKYLGDLAVLAVGLPIGLFLIAPFVGFVGSALAQTPVPDSTILDSYVGENVGVHTSGYNFRCSNSTLRKSRSRVYTVRSSRCEVSFYIEDVGLIGVKADGSIVIRVLP